MPAKKTRKQRKPRVARTSAAAKKGGNKQIQKVNVQVQSSGGSGGGGSSMPAPSYMPSAFRDTSGEAKRYEGILDTIKSIEKDRKMEIDAIQKQLREKQAPASADIETVKKDDKIEDKLFEEARKMNNSNFESEEGFGMEPSKVVEEPPKKNKLIEEIFNKPIENNKSLLEISSAAEEPQYISRQQPAIKPMNVSNYEDNLNKIDKPTLLQQASYWGITRYNRKQLSNLNKTELLYAIKSNPDYQDYFG
jgi:hypothetical protein